MSHSESVDDITHLVTVAPGRDRRRGQREDWSRGRRIGPYRIERPLGRGGMATVFLAVRADDYTQKVALKLVSWDMDRKEIQDRFYNERQILANLQHPMIARLLDGGTTDDGRPYFIMEHVEGEPIDRYCQRHQLSIRQRLELFGHVCSAVHSAHQNLVVHRDLKPSNILVTADGTPRLLDFGIAKLLEPDLAARNVATMPGTSPMTPAYASPEQVMGEPITTACDVYALGVLLYKLLTNRLPYRLKAGNYGEMVRVICMQEPKKPSHAVKLASAVPVPPGTTEAAVPAAVDSADAGPDEDTEAEPPRGDETQTVIGPAPDRRLRRQRRLLAGDLDAIVLKAIRKEPKHRYGSAIELAEDVRCHLMGLPVVARQGTWLYYAGKFVRRNRLALAVMFLIAGLAVTTTVLWRKAVDEQAQAVRERTRAERVSAFLENLFKSADPDQAKGETLTVREILDQGKERITGELESEPEIRADILTTLGTVYHSLGLYGQSREVLEEALRVRRIANPAEHQEMAIDINNLASVLYSQKDYPAAERYFREALAMKQRLGLGTAGIANTMQNLASALAQQGHLKEAERIYQQVLEMHRNLAGPESAKVATSLYSLGALAARQGDFGKAESLLNQALAIRVKVSGDEHTEVAQILDTLGRAHHAAGNLDEAEPLYTRALGIRRKLLGDNNVVVARTKRHLAVILLDQGDFEAAARLIEQALTTYRQVAPDQVATIADSERVFGETLLALGRHEESEKYLVASYQMLREEEDEQAATRQALRSLIGLYESWGRPAEAARYRAISRQAAASESWAQGDSPVENLQR